MSTEADDRIEPALKSILPLPLSHSWPLFERGQHFDLGRLHDGFAGTSSDHATSEIDALAIRGIGVWECDLSDGSLTWSAQVYDAFGLPSHARITRAEAVALYREESRAAMERLRAHAIRHRRGFTLDAEIRPAQGEHRWIRLVAAPICDASGRVVRLHGLKQDISHEYKRRRTCSVLDASWTGDAADGVMCQSDGA